VRGRLRHDAPSHRRAIAPPCSFRELLPYSDPDREDCCLVLSAELPLPPLVESIVGRRPDAKIGSPVDGPAHMATVACVRDERCAP
jgi:hypothetical protein